MKAYTVGSGIDNRIGFTVCIFSNNTLLHSLYYQVSLFKSVSQAEVTIIVYAVKWVVENNYSICIKTDSLSSIQILNKHDCDSIYIN